MSRTYKDRPWRIQKKHDPRTRYEWCLESPPRWYVQMAYNRPERHQAKRDLKKGIEPFPHQPRNRAWFTWW